MYGLATSLLGPYFAKTLTVKDHISMLG